MLTHYIKQLIQGHSLNSAESEKLISALLENTSPEQSAAVLVLLKAKGETATEVATFVRVLKQHQVKLNISQPVLDIVGTGGDGANTANISSMAAMLAASCGAMVLKHGNRAVSSRCGSADFMEALGISMTGTPELIETSVMSRGFGFCYAPLFNPLFQSLKSIRHHLKVPTVFNLMGPLLNPAPAQTLLLGVSDPKYLSLMAECLVDLKVKRAMVVHGQGLDELNTLGPCDVIELEHGKKHAYRLDPQLLGLPACTLEDLSGGDASYHAQLFNHMVLGQESRLADTVVLNAGAGLYLSGHASSIREGIMNVREAISAGHAYRYVAELLHA